MIIDNNFRDFQDLNEFLKENPREKVVSMEPCEQGKNKIKVWFDMPDFIIRKATRPEMAKSWIKRLFGSLKHKEAL